MTGGASDQKLPQYYAGHSYPYPPVRFETQNGLKLMLVAIIFFTLSYVLRAISVHSQSYEFTGISQEQYDNAMLIGWTSVFFTALFIITVIIALIMFYRGRTEVNSQHAKNVKWSIIFFTGYIIVSLLSIIIALIYIMTAASSNPSHLTSSVYYIYSGFPQAFYVLQSFFLGFMILLVVKELVCYRVKFFLFFIMILIILIAITDAMIDIFDASLFNPETNEDFAEIIRFKAYFILLHALIWFLAVIVYFYILRNFKLFKEIEPAPILETQQPSRPVTILFETMSIRPYIPFAVMFVVAIILGAAAANAAQEPRRLGIVSGLPIWEDEESYYYEDYMEQGELQEYESIDVTVEIDREISAIDIQLWWQDESDLPLRDNKPDRFNVNAQLDGLQKSVTDEDGQDGSGYIVIQWTFSEDKLKFVNEALITLTLEYAGDQEGPGGISGSPLVTEDNANEYTLSVSWGYYE